MLSTLSTRCSLFFLLPASWASRLHGSPEQSRALWHIPCTGSPMPTSLETKGCNDEAKLGPVPARCQIMAGPWLPARVQLGPGSWKILLGLYSTSGMFLKIEPAAEPRSDKMEPGTWPGLFFWIYNPKIQQPRHHKSNRMPDKLGCFRPHAFKVHIWVYHVIITILFQYGATLPFMAFYLK